MVWEPVPLGTKQEQGNTSLCTEESQAAHACFGQTNQAVMAPTNEEPTIFHSPYEKVKPIRCPKNLIFSLIKATAKNILPLNHHISKQNDSEIHGLWVAFISMFVS